MKSFSCILLTVTLLLIGFANECEAADFSSVESALGMKGQVQEGAQSRLGLSSVASTITA